MEDKIKIPDHLAMYCIFGSDFFSKDENIALHIGSVVKSGRQEHEWDLNSAKTRARKLLETYKFVYIYKALRPGTNSKEWLYQFFGIHKPADTSILDKELQCFKLKEKINGINLEQK